MYIKWGTIELSKYSFKWTLIIISTSVFIYHGINLIYLWGDIPNQIAIHFSGGSPDNGGPKTILFILPVISFLFWISIGLLIRNPEKLNYVNLTEENREVQYSKVGKGMLLIQNFGFIFLILVNEAILNNAVGEEFSLPFTIAIALLVMCFLIPFYLLFWAATLKY